MSKPSVNRPAASQRLRRIAILVDEPDPGQFYWVLHESTEDATVWLDLQSSEATFPSWLAAHDAGNKELLRMVRDKKTGPLAAGEDENTSPVG
ncbi:hypothetical protein [Polaromonas sp. JS666]|uniref:hypothetical protein n=1 Tax=Polaromonas sp. (strain JS666 / ATCC BAA-500) TaxID=296591 RepID=UPI0002E31AC9|nr:hypothetical protein [Polaromonas sp. JS666]